MATGYRFVLADQKLLFLLLVLVSGWVIYVSSSLAYRFSVMPQLRPLKAATGFAVKEDGFVAEEFRVPRRNPKQIQEIQQQQLLELASNSSSNLMEAAAKQSAGIKFMLVTGERSSACKTSEGSFILMKSYKNKVDYCNLHGCKVWFTLETWDRDFRGTWARYPLLKQLMQMNPEVEWFMWMDGDAIFTDFSFPIPFHDYENKQLVVPGYFDKVYGDNPDWVGLNAGVFLIRNSNWSMNFLSDWMQLNSESATVRINAEIPSRPQSWAADDQSALVYLLRHLSTEDRAKTFLELRYCLHGYWALIIPKLINSASSSRPFVTHFCGCSFCGNGDRISSECSQGFHRAYNFADNQLLWRARIKHLDLNSAEVFKF